MKKKLSAREKGIIRLTIWTRQEGMCLWCGEPTTLKMMHCHEVIPRGRGGKMSIENSIGLCAECHIFGPNAAHVNRKPKFSKIKLDK